MTGDRSRLRNFVKKFIGTVRFGNDHFGAIMGYGDYVIGDSVISRVYYVDGLGHNLFSIRQFCDSDLEVAFRKHSCYDRDTDGVELIKGSRGSNLYTILVEDMMKFSLICLLSKASKNKWLWHRRLNHLNFSTINDLARKDLVRGLPRLKFEKDHLCFACQLDLCGVMQVQTINGKKYILVIIDDYSRVFGAICYPTNDSEDLGKLQPTTDIGIFVGYAPSRKGYRMYNKRTRRIMETIHVQFDELTEQMAPVQLSTGPAPTFLTPRQISLGIVPNPVPAAPYVIEQLMTWSGTDLKMAKLVMSSPNHPTSGIKDAFSSNFPDFIPASPDYVPASPGKTYSSSSNNSFGLVPIASPTLLLFHDDPYMKVMQAYYAKE
ncbi:integrase, catalytic region, zinc finger, CCHC-type containing protein [Tanacetum coccineum]